LPASVAPSPASVFGKVPMEVNQYFLFLST